MDDSEQIPIAEIVGRIIRLNERLRAFWSDAYGWASPEVASMLAKARLDWQVSLSYSLRKWVMRPLQEETDATQILGYANLGALVEGTMQLFLSVYHYEYSDDPHAIKKKKNSTRVKQPEGCSLRELRRFYRDVIWHRDDQDDFRPTDNWDPWIERVQNRRNAIHAFRDRGHLGSHSELVDDIRVYLRFLRRINRQLPYDGSGPDESENGLPEYGLDDSAPEM